MVLQKVLSGRRITLPKDFCDDYNIKEGDYVDVRRQDGLLIVAVNVEIRERRRK